MEKYGVFISHNHEDWLLAGRVYDFFDKMRCFPFFDSNSMHSGRFKDEIKSCIEHAPYFVCILTQNTFQSLWVKKEVKIALENNRQIILIGTEDFKWPDDLPKNIKKITEYHIHTVNQKSYIKTMKSIFDNDVDPKQIDAAIDWIDRLNRYSNTFVNSREVIENHTISFEDRFGKELIKQVKNDLDYVCENNIKFIHMSCYAANIVFTPKGTMVDERAYDSGLMSKLFRKLLSDEEFSLEIIINAPFSYAANEAIQNERIGNSSLEENPEIAFLASYINMMKLIQEDPVYHKAYLEKRFRFMLTDKCLPYSIFHIKYKIGFENQNHVKIDLYSENMISNMERRSMIFSQKYNQTNYEFFLKKYDYIRDIKKSKTIIEENKEIWNKKWNDYMEDFDDE